MGMKSGDGADGPLTARQLVLILVVLAILAATFLSVRANFHTADKIDQQTQCTLTPSACR